MIELHSKREAILVPLFGESIAREWSAALVRPDGWTVAESWLKSNNLPCQAKWAYWLHDAVARAVTLIADILGDCDADQQQLVGWIEHCANNHVHAIHVEWGSTAASALHQSLADGFKALFKDRAGPLTQTETYEIFHGGYESFPTFGIFPFYLTAERRRHWAVLPYARLTDIGFVTNMRTATQFFGASVTQKDGCLRATIDVGQLTSFLDRLHSHPKESMSVIHFGLGHAAWRIAASRLTNYKHRAFFIDLLETYDNLDSVQWARAQTTHDVLKPPRGKAARAAQPHPRSPEQRAILRRMVAAAEANALFEYLLERNGQHPRVVVTDFGVQEYLRLKVRDGEGRLVHLRLPAGGNVPVGLGFSLTTMPMFLRNPPLLKDLSDYLTKEIWLKWYRGQADPRIHESVLMDETSMTFVPFPQDTGGVDSAPLGESPLRVDRTRLREVLKDLCAKARNTEDPRWHKVIKWLPTLHNSDESFLKAVERIANASPEDIMDRYSVYLQKPPDREYLGTDDGLRRLKIHIWARMIDEEYEPGSGPRREQ